MNLGEKSVLVLLILDGWGFKEKNIHDAIAAAKTPHWDSWWKEGQYCLLEASGLNVGLPKGQMGNSEVGHMHIGAGRVLMQDFTRINAAIERGDFEKNQAFKDTIKMLKNTGKALHIMGLFSDGGVHSHENHLYAFLDLCQSEEFSHVFLHLFLDGRDTPPQSVLPSLLKLEEKLKKTPNIKIASISGRYFAMDRDKRWSRVELVYRLLTEGLSEESFENPRKAIEAFYAKGLKDEFIPPTRIGKGAIIGDGDGLFFFNFRADRARQLTEAFINPNFSGFVRPRFPLISTIISMTLYDKNLQTLVAFPPVYPKDTLGEILSKEGLRQLRIAETEKYAHVTFFFNGGIEHIFPLEERKLIPSPKVATYDLKPEMSAPELTKTLVEAIKSQAFDVIICNYANADMVGHSGDFQATVSAIECLDACMGNIAKALEKVQGTLLITSDHGNAEIMFDETTQQPHTAHTCQPVPFVFVGKDHHFTKSEGKLTDIAPTILTLLGIKIPASMTGENLIVPYRIS